MADSFITARERFGYFARLQNGIINSMVSCLGKENYQNVMYNLQTRATFWGEKPQESIPEEVLE